MSVNDSDSSAVVELEFEATVYHTKLPISEVEHIPDGTVYLDKASTWDLLYEGGRQVVPYLPVIHIATGAAMLYFMKGWN